MKIKLTLLLFSLVVFNAFAAETSPEHLSVAVYDFKGDAETKDYGSKVTALITANLAANTNLVMLERAELEKALNEQAFGISGMVSSDAAAKIGQVTGVKVLISGQVITLKQNHLVIIANIIGTETGRLFAAEVEGAADNLMKLTSDLSLKIAKTISAQAANLSAATEESHVQRLERMMVSIKGTNRPTVSVAILFYSPDGRNWRDNYAEYEFGTVLLKAGFTVLDDNSDRKADIEITGDASAGLGPQRGNLISSQTAIEVKVQERRTGKIITFDRQEGKATGVAEPIVARISHVNAVDGLAERVLPLLAK
jgi:TolB-like protein